MVEVIGAGLPRTGTSSMKAGLEQLGFAPTYHMFELMSRPDQLSRWLHALEGDPVDWDHVTEGYPAGVDWPFSFFWRELAAAYPQAKVVLTVRDPQTWYTSMASTIFQGVAAMSDGAAPPGNIGEDFAKLMRPMFGSLFAGELRVPSEEESVAAFERHREAVIEAIPAERLLVFQVSQGWEPLCDFLGVPVPDTPFPHLNETEAMHRVMADIEAGRDVTSPFD